MKILIFIILCLFELNAVSLDEVVGEWQATTKSVNQGTNTVEKEYLHFNADRTFSIVLLVSIEKDNSFVKDLRIEASGIWKVWEETLVAVVHKVNVPIAGEVYGITTSSLKQIAQTFKQKFENEPIRISMVKDVTANSLTLSNEKRQKTVYTRSNVSLYALK